MPMIEVPLLNSEKLLKVNSFHIYYIIGYLGVNSVLTSRSSTAHYVRWTVFKSQFFGFAAQKYSTKLQLKSCRLARR